MLSVYSLVQVIGDIGLQLDSAIEIVSCALTAAGLYFSFTGDAKGWFNGVSPDASGWAKALSRRDRHLLARRHAIGVVSTLRTAESCKLSPMEWTDEGIVLGVRRHGESSAIVELLTRGHGRHLGLVRGGAGSRMRPLLQPGNSVRAVWRARLDEHLGYYAIEGMRLRAATVLASSHAVYGVTHLASLARLLPERDPHRGHLRNAGAHAG